MQRDLRRPRSHNCPQGASRPARWLYLDPITGNHEHADFMSCEKTLQLVQMCFEHRYGVRLSTCKTNVLTKGAALPAVRKVTIV